MPTVRDRVAQAAVYSLAGPRIEAELEDSSHGYRPRRSVYTAVARIRELRDHGYRWVVDADIEDFFGTIPHDRLLARVDRLGLDPPGAAPTVRALLARWIRAEVYDGRTLRTLDRGIPQGAVVSPMLANLFLDELDERLAASGQRAVRYADDFLVLCRSPEAADEALELTDSILESLGLDLHRGKTSVTSFAAGFRFLGAVFLGDSVLRPFPAPRRRQPAPSLPPPLDLRTYLELAAAASGGE